MALASRRSRSARARVYGCYGPGQATRMPSGFRGLGAVWSWRPVKMSRRRAKGPVLGIRPPCPSRAELHPVRLVENQKGRLGAEPAKSAGSASGKPLVVHEKDVAVGGTPVLPKSRSSRRSDAKLSRVSACQASKADFGQTTIIRSTSASSRRCLKRPREQLGSFPLRDAEIRAVGETEAIFRGLAAGNR